MTGREKSVLRYLARCDRASARLIRRNAGGADNTMISLLDRGYVSILTLRGVHGDGSYRITDAGREAAAALEGS